MNVGVIGCGSISNAYFKFAQQFPQIDVVAVSDLNLDAARAKAKEWSVPDALPTDALLRRDDIELVINLTIPKAHVQVGLAAIEHGKHVYAEKPLGIDRAEGKRLIEAAAAKGLRVGSAPDTFLGSAHQTARRLIDDGAIGRPVAFHAFMQCGGHESWHPNPEFYYDHGGGPMLDMGPYYLTALVNLLGPIERVAGQVGIQIPDREITHDRSGKLGQKLDVKVPDHYTGTLRTASGVLGTVTTSFAMRVGNRHGFPPITVYGTEGTLECADPNGFDGEVHLCRRGGAYETVEPTFPAGYGRAVGVADMILAIQEKRPHRCNGDLAYHVLDAMIGFADAGTTGQAVELDTRPPQPEPMPRERIGELERAEA